MSVLEVWMSQREEAKTRAEHPLADPLSEEDWTQIRHDFQLPDRQFQVVRLICRACTDAEIAEIIGIDSNTVRMHVRRILERLNVRTRMGVLVMLINRIREVGADETIGGALK
jgi:DNA-binding CsgD family transcriptional regulator